VCADWNERRESGEGEPDRGAAAVFVWVVACFDLAQISFAELRPERGAAASHLTLVRKGPRTACGTALPLQ